MAGIGRSRGTEVSRAVRWAGTLAGVTILWGEAVHWWAARRLVSTGRGGSEAVVVLGYRNRDTGRANVLNRWRVRAGLRSIDFAATASRLVFCGGTREPGSPTEAALMAEYAVEKCGYRGEMVLDELSRTTWENIQNAIPLIEDADRIKIVSNPLHGLRGRILLRQQRPDLARRLVRAQDYRFGEWTLFKPLLAVYGLLDLARARKRLAD